MSESNKSQESSDQLVEGKDYYIEDGAWVFTKEYHLKRGYCCSSGCRHCPWEDQHCCQSGCVDCPFTPPVEA